MYYQWYACLGLGIIGVEQIFDDAWFIYPKIICSLYYVLGTVINVRYREDIFVVIV